MTGAVEALSWGEDRERCEERGVRSGTRVSHAASAAGRAARLRNNDACVALLDLATTHRARSSTRLDIRVALVAQRQVAAGQVKDGARPLKANHAVQRRLFIVLQSTVGCGGGAQLIGRAAVTFGLLLQLSFGLSLRSSRLVPLLRRAHGVRVGVQLLQFDRDESLLRTFRLLGQRGDEALVVGVARRQPLLQFSRPPLLVGQLLRELLGDAAQSGGVVRVAGGQLPSALGQFLLESVGRGFHGYLPRLVGQQLSQPAGMCRRRGSSRCGCDCFAALQHGGSKCDSSVKRLGRNFALWDGG